METAVCTSSSEAIPDGLLNQCHDCNSLISSENSIISNPATKADQQEFNLEGKNQNNMTEDFEETKNYNSPRSTEVITQKSLSPSLIEHAFNVVKNLFSPEKNRGKSANLMHSMVPQNLLGSPANFNNDQFTTDYGQSENAIKTSTYSFLCENGTKASDAFAPDALELTVKSVSNDGRDGDESFLTSVSLIDDSFQSAVTHLDETAETRKNDLDSPVYVFDYVKNLEIPEIQDSSMSSNENGLERTMVKNCSFASDTKSHELSHGENLDKPKEFTSRTFLENDVEDDSNKENELATKKESCNLKHSYPLLDHDFMENSENIRQINTPSKIGKDQKSEIAEIFVNKSFEPVVDVPIDGSNLNTLNFNSKSDNSEKSTSSEKFNGSCHISEKTGKDLSNMDIKEITKDSEKDLEANISTTTITLSGANSNLDLVASLKEEDVVNEIIVKEKSAVVNNEYISPRNQDVNSKNNGLNESVRIAEKGKKLNQDYCSPKKLNKNKLNKSGEFLPRKCSQKSPKHMKNFRKKTNPEIGLMESKSHYTGEDYLQGDVSSNAKNLDSLSLTNGRGDKNALMGKDAKQSPQYSVQNFSVLSSQQSYTILDSSDKKLKRPIISFEESNVSPTSVSPDKTSACETKIPQTCQGNTPEQCNTSTGPLTGTLKQSTPLNEGMDCTKSLPMSGRRGPSPVPEKDCLNFVSKVSGDMLSPGSCESVSVLSLNGEPIDFSPVTPVDDKNYIFSNSSEREPDGVSPSAKNTTFVKHTSSSSFTVEKKIESPLSGEMNQTFNKIPGSNNLNQTFEVKPTEASAAKLNQTFDKKQVSANTTFEIKTMADTTDILMSTGSDRLNQTYDMVEVKSESKSIDQPTPPESEKETQIIEPKPCPTIILDHIFLKPSFSHCLESTAENELEAKDSSFLSATSSNTSLLCNGNSTVILNQGQLDENHHGSDDLICKQKEFSVISLPKEFRSSSKNTSEFTQMKSKSTGDVISKSSKETKPNCDHELVQLIREQFTSTDIEKICSVVDDMTNMKLGNELFQKPAPVNPEETKFNTADGKPSMVVDPLSPTSFDFLSSIGGKPTGRDWSRESLYVKFDPLVQAPTANSLIDFTKEVEALADLETTSPTSDTVVEQLLAISPQKQADDIVPPLTPLSQRNKSIKDSKMEKCKELQNEIYFLKNMYLERERINKLKLDDYEHQIARLTGQSCMMEDKLKESNEREKSLVKKLNEQKQSIEQLKTIMEEYMKVITRLTTELENSKAESEKQLQTLKSERDSYMVHLQNTEAAFTDVHAKYEKCKKTIINQKANETMFKNTIAEQIAKMEKYKEKAQEAQEKAYEEFERVQGELENAKSKHSQEIARLRAQLRKTELKLEAIQESLEQKIKENKQLTAICDELIEGKK